MKTAQLAQYATAIALAVSWFLTDDQVLGAIGLWLSPSLVTLLGAAGSVLARKAGP